MKLKVLEDFFDLQVKENRKKGDIFEADISRSTKLIGMQLCEMYKAKEINKQLKKIEEKENEEDEG